MYRIPVTLDLPAEELQFLGELAELKHRTLADLLEEAVIQFAERQRERSSRAIGAE